MLFMKVDQLYSHLGRIITNQTPEKHKERGYLSNKQMIYMNQQWAMKTFSNLDGHTHKSLQFGLWRRRIGKRIPLLKNPKPMVLFVVPLERGQNPGWLPNIPCTLPTAQMRYQSIRKQALKKKASQIVLTYKHLRKGDHPNVAIR